MSAEKAFRGDVWTHGGPQSRQHVHALRTLLEVWQRHVLTDAWMTPQYRERVQEVVRNAHASLDDVTAYETALLVLAPAFAVEGEEQVLEVELPDDNAAAAATLIKAVFERTAGPRTDDPAEVPE